MTGGLLWAAAALGASLEGLVVDEAGEPVQGAYAVVYDQRLSYAYAVTNAAGSFRVVDLPANPYRLRILPPAAANLVESWHPAGLDVCGAAPIALGDVSGVEIALAAGGEIVGVLLDTDGQPVRDATVVARPSLSGFSLQARSGVTGEDGSFAVRGLPGAANGPSGWRLEVQIDGWPFQWLPGVYEEVDAAVYEVSPGGVADAASATLLDGIAVGGAVTGPWGPLTDGDVYAYSPSQVTSAPIVDGRYLAIGLPPGEVLSWASANGYAMTYYPDADRPGDRVAVLEEGAVYESLDLDVPGEAVFQGRITGVDGDLSGVSVLAYNDARTVGIGAQCAADGTFAIEKLHGGDYTLFVYAADEGLVNDFVRDTAGEPVVYALAAEAASPVFDVGMPRGAVVAGRIVDQVDGAPVYGAWIVGEGVGTGEIASAETDHDGRYVLDGLVADLWELRIDYHAYCPSDPGWVDLYWPDTVDPARAGRLELGEGEAATWDAELPRDDDHDLMDDAWETASGLDPALDDSAEDPDGDGYTNLEEYRLGTDPLDAGRARRGCGCDALAGGSAVAWLPLAVLVGRRRRVSNRCQLLNGSASG